MIKKYSNFKATAMKILVKINQHNYDNCELLDCRVVGLGGLEPPTSPLSGVRSNQAELQTQSCLHKKDSTQIFGERIIRVVSFFVNEKVGINYYALFNFYLAKDLYKLKYT